MKTGMEHSFAPILLVFAALMIAAVACDLHSRRIPNGLVLAGMALGLLFQTVAPSGGGLFVGGSAGGAIGFGQALLGAAVGLALLMPMYALRTLGAGDVKLLGMVGMWLGAGPVAWAALWTLLAGGALALVVALGSGMLRQVLANLNEMVLHSYVRARVGLGLGITAPERTTGRLPYALAISCGVAAEVGRQLMQAGT